MDFCRAKSKAVLLTHKKKLYPRRGFCLFFVCLHLFGYITAMRKEVVKYGCSMILIIHGGIIQYGFLPPKCSSRSVLQTSDCILAAEILFCMYIEKSQGIQTFTIWTVLFRIVCNSSNSSSIMHSDFSFFLNTVLGRLRNTLLRKGSVV